MDSLLFTVDEVEWCETRVVWCNCLLGLRDLRIRYAAAASAAAGVAAPGVIAAAATAVAATAVTYVASESNTTIGNNLLGSIPESVSMRLLLSSVLIKCICIPFLSTLIPENF